MNTVIFYHLVLAAVLGAAIVSFLRNLVEAVKEQDVAKMLWDTATLTLAIICAVCNIIRWPV